MRTKETSYELTAEYLRESPENAEMMLRLYVSLYRHHRTEMLAVLAAHLLLVMPTCVVIMFQARLDIGIFWFLVSLYGVGACLRVLNPRSYNLQRVKAK